MQDAGYGLRRIALLSNRVNKGNRTQEEGPAWVVLKGAGPTMCDGDPTTTPAGGTSLLRGGAGLVLSTFSYPDRFVMDRKV
jgi:NAD(P)H-hydrate repair Nnr-like enzyme with NAD(P)H-hydrate dehydratase domain